MLQHSPLMITVAPNGARKTRLDHPQLPITPTQLAATAKGCVDAGACMLHLHVRDRSEVHSLDPDAYREALQVIRRATGSEMIIQITTEAVGRYQPDQQMQVVRDIKPEAVSLALREICPTATEEKAAGEFFKWLHREQISPQYILYSVSEIHRCNELQARGVIPNDSINVLLVLGRYTDGQQSNVTDLPPLVTALNPGNIWSVCAFGVADAAQARFLLGID